MWRGHRQTLRYKQRTVVDDDEERLGPTHDTSRIPDLPPVIDEEIYGEQLERRHLRAGSQHHIPLKQRKMELTYEEKVASLHGKKLSRKKAIEEKTEQYRQYVASKTETQDK